MRMELFNSTSPIALLCNYDPDRDVSRPIVEVA